MLETHNPCNTPRIGYIVLGVLPYATIADSADFGTGCPGLEADVRRERGGDGDGGGFIANLYAVEEPRHITE